MWTIINYVSISLTVIVSTTDREAKLYEHLLNDCMTMNKITILQKAENEEYVLFGSS